MEIGIDTDTDVATGTTAEIEAVVVRGGRGDTEAEAEVQEDESLPGMIGSQDEMPIAGPDEVDRPMSETEEIDARGGRTET